MSVVVITGASSGIGRALALAWAEKGASIVLSARNEAALRDVAREVTHAGGEAFVEAGDVTNEDHRRRVVERALAEKGRLDVLVNNAGRGYYATVAEVDARELEQLFALNVVAPVRLSQIALEALGKSRGAIVMMSSVAGVVAAPRMGAYAATKFALEAMAMSLRAEVRGRGIRVLVVRPGPVDTPFRAHSVTASGRAGVRPHGARPQLPTEIATRTIRAVERHQSVLETSLFVRVASVTARVAPAPFRWISARMAAKEA